MLIAYFDESGHAASTEFVSIAAYVADETVWIKFDAAWGAVLKKHAVSHLHAAELANLKGIYKNWNIDQQKAFSADLMHVMQTSGVMIAAGAALSTKDFRSLTKKQQSMLVNPFFPLFQEVIRAASINALFRKTEFRVKMVFSQQDEFRGLAEKLYNIMSRTLDTKDRLGGLEFKNMRQVPGLQAADVLAYEICRYYKDKAKNPRKEMRWPLKQMLIPQAVYRAALIRFIPLWRLRLQLQPPWIFRLITVASGWIIGIPAFFFPRLWHLALGTPELPKPERKMLRDFERNYREEKKQ